jgi:hypothetical protein
VREELFLLVPRFRSPQTNEARTGCRTCSQACGRRASPVQRERAWHSSIVWMTAQELEARASATCQQKSDRSAEKSPAKSVIIPMTAGMVRAIISIDLPPVLSEARNSRASRSLSKWHSWDALPACPIVSRQKRGERGMSGDKVFLLAQEGTGTRSSNGCDDLAHPMGLGAFWLFAALLQLQPYWCTIHVNMNLTVIVQ